MKLKKIISGLISLSLSLTAFTGIGVTDSLKGIRTEAAAANWKFDFGNGGVASGFTGVSAADGYNAGKGYGFAKTGSMANVAASGRNELSDAVQFKSTDTGNTFNVDLPKGLYQVSVHLGNTTRTSVRAEGMLQLINMTGNNAYDTFQIPVTDGQLNIMATEGKAGYAFTMSSLEITQISQDPTMKPTIWLCGDSTVCNYYPLDTSAQGGWGQMLNKFVDTDKYEVRNMAASGQYAKGFVDAGQFAPIEYYGKPGDFYIISIGINDTNYSNETEYYNTVTDMVKRAKAKGMQVILVKQQGRRSDLNRDKLLPGRWFGGQLDTIGKEQNVQVVDLFTPWQNFGLSLGYDGMGSYYMSGDDLHPNRQGAIKLAELFAEQVDWNSSAPPQNTPVLEEGASYMFKNVNSGLYLEVAEGAAQAGANVQQWGADGSAAHNTWKTVSAGNGYYYLYSHLGNGDTFVLDVTAKKTENGTNMELYTFNGGDAQQFGFVQNNDGSLNILTKVTGGASCVEVVNAEVSPGANVQQWENNGHNCQKWIAEKVDPSTVTATVTTTAQVTTTVTTTTIPAPTVNVFPGDANVDDKVNMSDAVFIMQSIANPDKYSLTSQGRINADVAGDNDGITAKDAQYIQMHCLGLITLPEPGSVQTTTTTTTTAPVNKYDGYYFAVDQTFENGMTETVNAGYTKEDGYVNLDNSEASNITWTVDAPQNGNYLVTFRVANGTDADRKMQIIVNSNTQDYWMQPFTGTGGWTEWQDRGIVLPLNQGKNTIKLISATANGGPNFDYLTIEKTDEPIAETYVPQETPQPLPSENPVIYIAGDSTVQSYRASYAPQQGWGYYLADYFNSNVSVQNHAIAGRSSKSFYDNGRLDTILNTIKEGDYLFVQFAINDSASGNAERYAPVCGKVDNPTEGSYEWYMEKYIEGALDKGATPILVTTVIGLKAYSGGRFVNSYNNYCQACKDMAKKYNIPCIDLNTLMVNHYNSIGYDAAYKYHLAGAVSGSTDMTHFSETGANAVAKLVANAIKGLNIPLSGYAK